ncbi:MAG: MGMT family protein [Pseudoxanthomonas suwonensis]|nr:MGMT family protein [Pseudoxanthomonas suwonensis]
MASESPEDAILRAVRAIAHGQVLAYGEVARRAGLPRRARLVARILATTDAEVPWHRVIRSDGCIAFPADSDGFREQCRRLQAEGVTIERGRVRPPPRPRKSLDEQVWGPGPL